jgi:chloramphenicol 3-O phosphotransferase
MPPSVREPTPVASTVPLGGEDRVVTFALRHDLHPRLDQPAPGRIVILNGTSSSGKSGIAAALQKQLDQPYFHFAIDRFRSMGAGRGGTDEEIAVLLQRTVLGFHRAVAGFAAAGNNVIVDYVLGERWRLADCVSTFAGFDVVLVGVHCPVEELERRERERGNRPAGLAAFQFPVVHAGMRYDVEVDTAELDPPACAAKIKSFMDGGTRARALPTLVPGR